LPIYPQVKNGSPHLDRTGRQKYKVRVWDPHLKVQVERRCAGEDVARTTEVDLAALLSAPPAQRPGAASAGSTVGTRGARIGPVGAASWHTPTVNTATITVSEWALQYLELFKIRPDGARRSPASWKHDRDFLSIYVLPRIGARTLASIQLRDLDDMMRLVTQKNGEPLSGHTKQSIAACTKRMMKMAVRRGLLTINPAAELPTSYFIESDRAAIIPSFSDVELLAGCAEKAREGYGDIVELIAYTGMRFEELTALRVDDVDWHDASLFVHWSASQSGGQRHLVEMTKTLAGRRRIPITSYAANPLRRLVATGDERRVRNPQAAEEVLVVTGESGAALSYGSWRDGLQIAREASGVDLTAHELRHVAASIAIESGMNDREVASMMGHKSAEYTRRVYGHLWPRDGRKVADKLDAGISRLREQERELAKRNLLMLSDSQS
jgi:integrase